MSKTTQWAILGHLANQYQNRISLNLVNQYFQDYELKPLSRASLNQLIGEVSVKDSEANQVYLQYKLGKELNSLYDQELGQHSTTILKGADHHPIKVSDDELKKVALIVDELQQASPSHTFSWYKVKKLCLQQDILFSESQDFKDKVMAVLDETKEQPTNKKSPKQTRFLQDTLTNELGVLATRKRAIQNDQRNLNKVRRQITDLALNKQAIIEALADPIILENKIEPVSIQTKDNALYVCVSDLHMGATTELFTGDYNAYSKHDANLRMQNYQGKVASTIQLYQPKQVKVVMLGDLVENVQMRKNQAYDVEGTLAEQIKWGCETITNFLAGLATRFPDITFEYTEIEGNHDRFAPDKKDSLSQDGISMVATTIIQATLKYLDNILVKELEDHYRYLDYDHTNNLLFVHGDKDKLTNNSILGQLSAYLDTPLDAVVGGHLHSLQAREVGKQKFILQTGSVIGSTEYSNQLGVTSSPSQLMILSNSEGIQPIFTFL